jgi:hypothetical protein
MRGSQFDELCGLRHIAVSMHDIFTKSKMVKLKVISTLQKVEVPDSEYSCTLSSTSTLDVSGWPTNMH